MTLRARITIKMIENIIKEYQKTEETRPILVIGSHNKELSKILDFRLFSVDVFATRKERPEHYSKYFVVDSSDYLTAINKYVCEFQEHYRIYQNS